MEKVEKVGKSGVSLGSQVPPGNRGPDRKKSFPGPGNDLAPWSKFRVRGLRTPTFCKFRAHFFDLGRCGAPPGPGNLQIPASEHSPNAPHVVRFRKKSSIHLASNLVLVSFRFPIDSQRSFTLFPFFLKKASAFRLKKVKFSKKSPYPKM